MCPTLISIVKFRCSAVERLNEGTSQTPRLIGDYVHDSSKVIHLMSRLLAQWDTTDGLSFLQGPCWHCEWHQCVRWSHHQWSNLPQGHIIGQKQVSYPAHSTTSSLMCWRQKALAQKADLIKSCTIFPFLFFSLDDFIKCILSKCICGPVCSSDRI